MPRLYSADRRNLYNDGPLHLWLEPPQPHMQMLATVGGNQEDVKDHVLEQFPEGLSGHGWDFVTRQHYVTLTDGRRTIDVNCAIEMIFEYVRRTFFPDRPSRFQSFFAFDNEARVRSFSPEPIYEFLEADYFRADIGWLRAADQIAGATYLAKQYWLGSATEAPDWEYLVKPPISIVRL